MLNLNLKTISTNSIILYISTFYISTYAIRTECFSLCPCASVFSASPWSFETILVWLFCSARWFVLSFLNPDRRDSNPIGNWLATPVVVPLWMLFVLVLLCSCYDNFPNLHPLQNEKHNRYILQAFFNKTVLNVFFTIVENWSKGTRYYDSVPRTFTP